MNNSELFNSIVNTVNSGYKVTIGDKSIYQEDELYLVVRPCYLAGKILDWYIIECSKVENAVKEFLK